MYFGGVCFIYKMLISNVSPSYTKVSLFYFIQVTPVRSHIHEYKMHKYRTWPLILIYPCVGIISFLLKSTKILRKSR